MWRTGRTYRPRTLLLALGFLGFMIGLDEDAAAQSATPPAGANAVSPGGPTTPPEIVKPEVAPSAVDDADKVFAELDKGGRGYVTIDDTQDLLGFDTAFAAVDTRGTGRLTRSQFRKAWSIYKAKK